MEKRQILLEITKKEDYEPFIQANQDAFRYGAMEEFGLRDDHTEEDGEIISRDTILKTIEEGSAYWILLNSEVVGGTVVKCEGVHGNLELLFVSSTEHNKGIGYAAWLAIQEKYPDVEIWETCTPYFEKRNIHFYVNRCGFHVVEFFNSKHPDLHASDNSGKEDGEMLRFEKRISWDDK